MVQFVLTFDPHVVCRVPGHSTSIGTVLCVSDLQRGRDRQLYSVCLAERTARPATDSLLGEQLQRSVEVVEIAFDVQTFLFF